MYKVIVVDDEMLIRKRIIYGFDWETMGYQIKGEAGDGGQALEMLEKDRYDLAIIDIAMPGMNGIELARLIRERKYRIHIIFLTGHSDFKYAQQAVKYGVYYYILKPVDGEEFESVLLKLRQKMEEENTKDELLEELERKQDHMDAVLRGKVFGEYFRDSSREDLAEAVTQELEGNGIDEDGGFQIALFWIEQFLKERKALPERAADLERVCGEVFAPEGKYLTACDIYEDYMVLFLKADSRFGTDGRLEELHCLRLRLEKETAASVVCGISTVQTGKGKIGTAYAEAVSALNNAKILEVKELPYGMVRKRGEIYYKIPYQEIKELQICLTKNDYEGCQRILSRVFGEMTKQKVSFECIVRNVNRLFMDLADGGVISELEMRRQFNGSWDAEKVLNNMADLGEMEEWCCNAIFTMMEGGIRLSLEGKSLPVIERACEYIRQNYRDGDLSQAGIAEAMAVTSPYLSGIFKKTMGITMVQYVTMVRMEAARELLLNEEVDVKDVAEQVGYHDEYYFSRCFKKQYGLSPLQMKKLSGTRRIGKAGLSQNEYH